MKHVLICLGNPLVGEAAVTFTLKHSSAAVNPPQRPFWLLLNK